MLEYRHQSQTAYGRNTPLNGGHSYRLNPHITLSVYIDIDLIVEFLNSAYDENVDVVKV